MAEEQNLILKEAEDNQHTNYRLKTVLTETGLNISLVIVDLEQIRGTLYTLSLSDAEMPDDLYFVFRDLETLFDSCFAKRENYEVKNDGNLLIKFRIKLADVTIPKQISIKLDQAEDGIHSDQAVIDKMASEFLQAGHN